MHLKLDRLQTVVKQAMNEEKAVDALKTEVRRVLGPIMLTDIKLEKLAEEVNDRVEVMNRTGRSSHLGFKPSVVVKFIDHENHEVRKMAANLLPEQFLPRLADDKNSAVRAIVARRVTLPAVKEMMRKFPSDDELRNIYRNRKKQLNEGGLPNAKPEKEPFDMYGEEPLGDAVKQQHGPELSDEWYHERSQKFLQDYGNNIEYNWEELAAKNFCNHTKATSGVEIDNDKMFKAIKDRIKEREDMSLERRKSALKELAASLRSESLLEESASEINETEEQDPVRSLVESRISPATYIERAAKLFNVREATVPLAIKKFKLGSNSPTTLSSIPMKARVPHNNGIRAIDEQALDAYVKHWNDRQTISSEEPLKIEWYVHPIEVGVIGFKAVLK